MKITDGSGKIAYSGRIGALRGSRPESGIREFPDRARSGPRGADCKLERTDMRQEGGRTMESAKEAILREVKRLRRETESDFAGLGLLDPSSRRVTWRIVVGSVSSRTPNMTQRPSVGLLGTTIRSGTPVCFDPSRPGAERARIEDPILLAEGLAAAVFLPVRTGTDIAGVLLLGRRLTKDYTDAEISRAVRGIKALGAREEWWRELEMEAAGWPKR